MLITLYFGQVHLSFSLDSSGLVHLAKAEVTVELPSVEPAATTNATAAVDGEHATASATEASAEPTAADAANATESASNGTAPDATVNSTATDANSTSTATVHELDILRILTLQQYRMSILSL